MARNRATRACTDSAPRSSASPAASRIRSSMCWASALVVMYAGVSVSRLAIAARARAVAAFVPEIATSDG